MKAVCAFVLAFVGVSLLVVAVMRARQDRGEGVKVWFYDERSGRLYAEAGDVVPPEKDRVRAVVVAPAADGRQQERKIAYLEMFGPPLKKVLESIRVAHRARTAYAGNIPARNSLFFRTNALVRRVGETNWVMADSAEGRKIMTEWRAWRGRDGQPWEVSVP